MSVQHRDRTVAATENREKFVVVWLIDCFL